MNGNTLLRFALISGFCGLVWWSLGYLREWQQSRQQETQRLKRLSLLARRREREAQQREQRRVDRLQKSSLAAQQAQERAEHRREAHRRHQEEVLRRQEQAVLAEKEAERLQSLPPDDFLSEVNLLLAQQNYHLVPSTEENLPGILYTKPGGQSLVMSCLSAALPGEASDVRILEAFRRDSGAQNALLIAGSGFTPEAVQASERLPVTLAEVHLLAHWLVTKTLALRGETSG